MAALLCAKDLCKTYVIDKRQNNVLSMLMKLSDVKLEKLGLNKGVI